MNEISSGENAKPRSVKKKLAEKISRFTRKYKNLFKSKKKSAFRLFTSSSSIPTQTFEKFQPRVHQVHHSEPATPFKHELVARVCHSETTTHFKHEASFFRPNHTQIACSKKPWDEQGTTNDVTNIQKYSFGWCIECGMQLSGIQWCSPCNAEHFYRQISEWTSWRLGLDNLIIQTQITASNVHSFFEWIPFENFDQVKYLAKGGYSIVYKAIWRQGPITYWDTTTNNWERFGGHEVVLKVIKGSQKNLDEFLNELSAHHKFGITVGHVLHIAKSLEIIHISRYVHRDLHTGNILRHGSWTMISDLGLTWRQDSVSTSERFGVLPYMVPKTLSGGQYSSASDIYSFAMVMYEIASGKIPFYHVINDINAINIIQGSRPKIKFAAPPVYIQIMKSCWDADPKKRPIANFLVKTFNDWIHNERKQLITIYKSFQNAEDERKNSITVIEEDHIPIINQNSQLIPSIWSTEAHKNAENEQITDDADIFTEKNSTTDTESDIFTKKNSTTDTEDHIPTTDPTSQLIH
ncbi:hypothetical protein RclHR1_03790014 [Rhizophagus clarus]|uniref:Protein kinase domain-containing protein n=1 Tax=Rhizophagus clarus TaxID=94130 RepID=A0A2Z6RE63_9GLOM|nr:hypothetical protein RclHR1_03790014 [Rhizophagus clarus]